MNLRATRQAARSARRRAAWLATGLLLAVFATGCVTTVSDVHEPDAFEKAAVRRNLGVDHLLNGRVALAIRELRHAVTLNPDDPVTHMWLSDAYARRGHLDLADSEMLRSLELDPDNHSAVLRYSVLLIRTQRYAEAIEYSDRLIADPTFESPWRAYTNRGFAQLKLGYYDVARRSFEEALEFQVPYWPATLNLGKLAHIRGDYDDALRHFGEVISANPGASPTSESHYWMAEIFVSLGLRDRALTHLNAAIELAPKGVWGRQSREYLQKLGGA